MEKSLFNRHFTSAIEFTIEFTQRYCYNYISDNHGFIIIPSSKMMASEMEPDEVRILRSLVKSQGKIFSKEEVIELLYHDNKVPLWINISIRESQSAKTIFELVCDGRFRDNSALNYNADKYPPFHPLVPIPPDNLRVEKDGKYDLNWQSKFEPLVERKSFLHLFRNLFSR